MGEGYFVCDSCGRKVKHYAKERPCEVLRGWLTVSQWKDVETVEHHYFCCLNCLKMWVEDKVPGIPEVFLKAFEEGEPG